MTQLLQRYRRWRIRRYALREARRAGLRPDWAEWSAAIVVAAWDRQ